MAGIGTTRVAGAAGLILTLACTLPGPATAKTSNGNDFALFFSEAGSAAERRALLDDARGRRHAFRYLRILKMEEGTREGWPYAAIVASEPASLMKVTFVVTKSHSLSILNQAPASVPGKGLAVVGKIAGVDHENATIELDPVIVRHKDRIEPKMGKELLGEVDPSAIYYSFTAFDPPVHLSYRDRDLLEFKSSILDKQGPKAWADFLRKKIAERERQRAGEAQP